LKKRFIKKPILVTLDLNKEIRVEADISNFTTRDILSIKYIDEK